MERNRIFQVEGTVIKITSKANRALRIHLDTQENLTDEALTKLITLVDKYGHFAFLIDEREIDAADLFDIPPMQTREEDKKSPAERLRSVLYVLWKQNGEKGDSETNYRIQMDKFINAVKDKLN